MDYLSSNWKLTFDPSGTPLVILAYGQMIDAELAWTLQATCEEVEPVDSEDLFLRDGRIRRYALAVKTYTTESLDLTARVNAMQSLIAVSALTRKPLRLEIQGHTPGKYWQWSSSFIKAHAPLRVLESNKARWSRQWDIVATGLSYV